MVVATINENSHSFSIFFFSSKRAHNEFTQLMWRDSESPYGKVSRHTGCLATQGRTLQWDDHGVQHGDRPPGEGGTGNCIGEAFILWLQGNRETI